jgi:hypothetical protein
MQVKALSSAAQRVSKVETTFKALAVVPPDLFCPPKSHQIMGELVAHASCSLDLQLSRPQHVSSCLYYSILVCLIVH